MIYDSGSETSKLYTPETTDMDNQTYFSFWT